MALSGASVSVNFYVTIDMWGVFNLWVTNKLLGLLLVVSNRNFERIFILLDHHEIDPEIEWLCFLYWWSQIKRWKEHQTNIIVNTTDSKLCDGIQPYKINVVCKFLQSNSVSSVIYRYCELSLKLIYISSAIYNVFHTKFLGD